MKRGICVPEVPASQMVFTIITDEQLEALAETVISKYQQNVISAPSGRYLTISHNSYKNENRIPVHETNGPEGFGYLWCQRLILNSSILCKKFLWKGRKDPFRMRPRPHKLSNSPLKGWSLKAAERKRSFRV